MKELADEPLAAHTTMRIGGPAARYVIAETTDELVDAVREVDDADEPLLILSGGSNVVIGEAGFPGTVVQVANTGVRTESLDACSGAYVWVSAGEPWDDFVAYACAQDWSGLEALSGIPGLAGATPVQNVGAYGQEVAQTIAQVRTLDRVTGMIRTFAAADAQFAYRDSIFKRTRKDAFGSRYVVLEVAFQLHPQPLSTPVRYADLATQLSIEQGQRAPLGDVREAVLAQRRRRGMVLDDPDADTWSCGSFFTNPIVTTAVADEVAQRAGEAPPRFAAPDGLVKLPAAWLIERAGFGKGYGMPGPAALSTKHPLAITNRGGATGEQIVALAREVRDGVQDRFGVTLVNEPVLVGLQL